MVTLGVIVSLGDEKDWFLPDTFRIDPPDLFFKEVLGDEALRKRCRNFKETMQFSRNGK